MFQHVKYLLVAFILFGNVCKSAAQSGKHALFFILQDEHKLSDYKKQYLSGNKTFKSDIDSLIVQADKLLLITPYSVTFQKRKLPPSGDIHDYMSQAPYWWPDTSKPDGKPYIRRDGRQNPERNLMKDREQMGQMCRDVKQLALTYYFTAKEPYVQKAVELMKVWFIDTATRMNPNLNYGQGIPGICDGRGIGIIETVGLTNIPDAMAMMQNSKYVSPEFVANMKNWLQQYTNWLVNSKNGKEERSQVNNHGTYYDVQLADFALFLGDSALACRVIKEQSIPRMDQQFTVDGAQPLELIRTKSWGYATMNLMGWIKLAIIADRVHIDLWHTETIDGKGIRRVVEWFLPYLLKEKNWSYEQIEPASNDAILSIYQLASEQYTNSPLQKVFNQYPQFNTSKVW